MPYPTASASTQNAAKAKKFKLIGIGIIAAAVLLLGVGGFFVYKVMSSGLKLEEYKGDGFSVLVPADYEQTKQDGMTVFKEDDDEESRSQIGVERRAFPRTLTDREIDDIIDLTKEGLEGYAANFSGKKEVTNVKVTETTHKGHKAVRLTADGEEDGKRIVKVYALFVVTDNALYTFIAGIHHQDTDLDKKFDSIVESFEIED